MTFVYDKIYLNSAADPEVWCEFMEWADNPYLDRDEIARLSGVLSPEALASRRYGGFAGQGEAVYPEFDERVHVIEPFVRAIKV